MAHLAGGTAAGARSVVPRTLLALVAVVFAGLLFRSAWIADDASITLRTVLNVTHGFGLTYNIAERVQTFTHPLWLFLLTAAYLVIGNVFVATIVVSIVVSVAAFLIAIGRASTIWQAGVTAIVLFFSRAFVDFAVSGLENPLFYLLLAVAVWMFVAWPPTDRRRLPGVWTVVSLLYLTRPDAILLVLPLALVATVQMRNWRRAGLSVLIGAIPGLVWTMFATIYYGFPFPNTAYAKLATGVDGAELRQQGWLYLVDSLDRDPITLTTIGFAIVVGVDHAQRRGARAGGGHRVVSRLRRLDRRRLHVGPVSGGAAVRIGARVQLVGESRRGKSGSARPACSSSSGRRPRTCRCGWTAPSAIRLRRPTASSTSARCISASGLWFWRHAGGFGIRPGRGTPACGRRCGSRTRVG